MSVSDFEGARRDDSGDDSGGPGGDASDARARRIKEVIEQTLVTRNPSEALTPAELESLRDVARRHRGKPFELDPIAVELVNAMLTAYFGGWSASPDSWRPMARNIARRLCDDPGIHERLSVLWKRLGEEPS